MKSQASRDCRSTLKIAHNASNQAFRKLRSSRSATSRQAKPRANVTRRAGICNQVQPRPGQVVSVNGLRQVRSIVGSRHGLMKTWMSSNKNNSCQALPRLCLCVQMQSCTRVLSVTESNFDDVQGSLHCFQRRLVGSNS